MVITCRNASSELACAEVIHILWHYLCHVCVHEGPGIHVSPPALACPRCQQRPWTEPSADRSYPPCYLALHLNIATL